MQPLRSLLCKSKCKFNKETASGFWQIKKRAGFSRAEGKLSGLVYKSVGCNVAADGKFTVRYCVFARFHRILRKYRQNRNI